MEKEYVLIRWKTLDCQVRAEILNECNPRACEEFKKSLPYKSIQSHAVVAGGQMYCPYRLILDEKDCNTENMAKQPPGRMNIELDFQYLSLNYDAITEAVPAVALLQIVEEDLDKIPLIGAQVWDNLLFSDEYIPVEFTYLGGEGCGTKAC